MNLKDAETYRKRTGKVPAGTILASPDPLELNEVFFLSGFRYRVKRAITKAEFQKKHMENLSMKDCAFGNFDITNNKATISDTEASFPSDDQKYFYEAEVIL